MSNLERWMMVIAVRAATTGETALATSRKTKKTRRRVITVRGEVRS